MKPEEKKKLQLLEEALKSAYRKKEKVELSEAWQVGVMKEVRSRKAPPTPFTNPEIFNRFAWRLAIAGASLTCLLIAYFFSSGSLPDVEQIEQIIVDPGRSIACQSWSFQIREH